MINFKIKGGGGKKWVGRIFIWLVILGPIAVSYSLTFGRYPVMWADSLELVTSAKHASLAHPPGYGLQTLFTWLVIKIFHNSAPALVANALNAIWQIMAIGFLVMVVGKLGQEWKLDKWKIKSAQIVTAWTVGWSSYIWFSANIYEVFALNNLLVLAILWGYLSQGKSWNKWNWAMWGLLNGIALGHQQLSVLVVAPLVMITFLERRKELKSTLWLGIGAGIISSAIFIALIGNRSPLGWRLEDGIGGLVRIMSRADYSGVLIDQLSTSNAYWKQIDISQSAEGLVNYVGMWRENYGWVALGLFIVGIYFLGKFRRGKVMIILWLISGPLLAFYLPLGSESSDENRILVERMYLQGYLLSGVIIGVGVMGLVIKISKWKIIIASLAILSVGNMSQNYKFADVSKFREPYANLVATIQSLPQNTRLFCFGDWSCFGSMYALYVEKIRSDVVLVIVTPQIQVRDKEFNLAVNYPDNPWRISEIYGQTLKDGYKVMFMELSNLYIRWLGLDGEIIASGTGYKLSCQANWDQVDLRNVNGNTWAHKYSQYVIESREKIAPMVIDEETPGKVCPKSTDWYEQARMCNARNTNCALYGYILATMMEPENITYRLDLASYLKDKAPELAKREYRLVLKFDPGNMTARSELEGLGKVKDLEWKL